MNRILGSFAHSGGGSNRLEVAAPDRRDRRFVMSSLLFAAARR